MLIVSFVLILFAQQLLKANRNITLILQMEELIKYL